MKRFEGQTIFITGAAGGIGAEVVRRFHAEGALVIATDYAIEGVAALAGSAGGRVVALALDVTDAAAVDAALAGVAAEHGPVDHLINCAGVASIVSTLEMSDEAWRRVYAINVDGTMHTSRAFARAVVHGGRKGSIVNLASVAGMGGMIDRAAYISTKHAVVGLTREMAMEFGPAGLRVNAIAPGIIRTPMTAPHFNDPDRAERIRKAHPLGRGGEPSEIAAAIAFLCSSDASFITGVILPVDGGYTAGKMW